MSALRTLQALAQRPPPSADEERCELCRQVLAERHRHMVDLERRSIRCACQACSLLFQERGAGRYRTIPDRVRVDPALQLTDALWSKLKIPVRLAFLFFNSRRSAWVAVYPGPAGATEAELDAAVMGELADATSLVGALEHDVEALLVWAPRGQSRFEVYLAPVDACYELVARIRKSWRGFEGGDEVRRQLADFFVRLRARARSLRVPKESTP